MTAHTIDYAGIIDKAMRGVVRDILRQVEKTGLPAQNHFFVSYRTDYPGVQMSDMLRSKYPNEITIVLQHQFWDLKVEESLFRVSLSFSNIPEKLVVPFDALLGFADPNTKFGLQFHRAELPHQDNAPVLPEKSSTDEGKNVNLDVPEEGKDTKIITLASFRDPSRKK